MLENQLKEGNEKVEKTDKEMEIKKKTHDMLKNNIQKIINY